MHGTINIKLPDKCSIISQNNLYHVVLSCRSYS